MPLLPLLLEDLADRTPWLGTMLGLGYKVGDLGGLACSHSAVEVLCREFKEVTLAHALDRGKKRLSLPEERHLAEVLGGLEGFYDAFLLMFVTHNHFTGARAT